MSRLPSRHPDIQARSQPSPCRLPGWRPSVGAKGFRLNQNKHLTDFDGSLGRLEELVRSWGHTHPGEDREPRAAHEWWTRTPAEKFVPTIPKCLH